MIRWLRRLWASMNWTPTCPPAAPTPRERAYQPLLDCLSIVDEEVR